MYTATGPEDRRPVRPAGSHAATRPVFVDSSGRRQRRVRRLGRLLVIPAAGYVALLLSTVLGGPSVRTPYLPLPAPPHHAAAPQRGQGTPAGRHTTGQPRSSRTPSGSATPSASGPAPSASASGTSGPTPTPTASPTATKHGKSGEAHPTPSHSAHGRGTTG